MKEFLKGFLIVTFSTVLLFGGSYLEATALYYHCSKAVAEPVLLSQLSLGFLVLFMGFSEKLEKYMTALVIVSSGLLLSTVLVASALAQASLQGL